MSVWEQSMVEDEKLEDGKMMGTRDKTGAGRLNMVRRR
jgi:hypothetical protein